MSQKRYQVDQMLVMLRRADVELDKGSKVPKVCQTRGNARQTYCLWRQTCDGLTTSSVDLTVR